MAKKKKKKYRGLASKMAGLFVTLPMVCVVIKAVKYVFMFGFNLS